MKQQVFDRRGGLGADLQRESTRYAAEKANKKKQYAEYIRMVAKTQMPTTERTSKPTVQDIELEKRRIYREKALEYARNVPKPKVLYRAIEPEPEPVQPAKEYRISETEELLRLIESHDELYREIYHYKMDAAE